MTPKQFKERWDSDENGDGISFDDIAECAKAWGLCSNPRIHPMDAIRQMVLQKAGIKEEQTYQPVTEEAYWKIVEAYAQGKPTKTGGDYRQTWIEMTHAGQEQIQKFDHDVDNYRAAANL